MFVREKKDGSHRVILNLKNVNQCVEKVHFKMESLTNAITLMTPGCYFASLDLKDAYYSVMIHEDSRKFFRFKFHGELYEFLVLPQGYRDSPRLFTKILKPILAHLRSLGYQIIMYIDDSLLVGESETECQMIVNEACKLMDRLGFTIHPTKSVFSSTQKIEFLGFILDSKLMNISLTSRKIMDIKNMCNNIMESKLITIQTFAELIGKLVATEPGIWIAPLFYKGLETIKIKALKENRGNYGAYIEVSDTIKDELSWWTDHIEYFNTPIIRDKPKIVVTSDASKKGWGGECNGVTTGGSWTDQEKDSHINILELKAALFSSKAFCRDVKHSAILLRTDNTTTVAHVNHKGSTKPEAHRIIKELWLWCLDNDNFVTATFLPGVDNTEADFQSRLNRDIEWKLDENIFSKIMHILGPCDTDLFASRVNNQLSRYVAWEPDPYAVHIDSFTLDWSLVKGYIFPSFSLMHKILQKIELD